MASPPRCWICKDEGIIFFNMEVSGMLYETVVRCSCVKGQDTSEIVASIHFDFAERRAKENLIQFRERYPGVEM